MIPMGHPVIYTSLTDATTIYDWRHYLAVVQRKPGALRNGAPFLELPPAFRQLQDHMLRKPGGDREMVDVLALVLHHDEQAVLAAVEMALAAGVPTKTHVLNLLHRLVDGSCRVTYEVLSAATQISRAKISSGLDVLADRGIVIREPNGRSTGSVRQAGVNYGMAHWDHRSGGLCGNA